MGWAVRQSGCVSWDKAPHPSFNSCKQSHCYHKGLKQNGAHPTPPAASTVPGTQEAPEEVDAQLRTTAVTLNGTLIKSRSNPKLPSEHSGLQPSVTSPLPASIPRASKVSPLGRGGSVGHGMTGEAARHLTARDATTRASALGLAFCLAHRRKPAVSPSYAGTVVDQTLLLAGGPCASEAQGAV